jgi:butyryl-CoA dehydrogenase
MMMRTAARCVRATSARSVSSYAALPEDHEMLKTTCADFADNELKPIAAKIDKEHLFPGEQIKAMGELGLMGVAIDPEYGGTGGTRRNYC